MKYIENSATKSAINSKSAVFSNPCYTYLIANCIVIKQQKDCLWPPRERTPPNCLNSTYLNILYRLKY